MNKIEIIKRSLAVRRSKLNIFVNDPFDTAYKMNLCYYRLCFFLEEGTNKLVYIDGEGNNVPITTPIFHIYLKMNRPSCNSVIYKLRGAGIILKVSIYGKNVYYFNPNYAFNGDKIPYFLMKLFEKDDDMLYGKHKFEIKEIDE